MNGGRRGRKICGAYPVQDEEEDEEDHNVFGEPGDQAPAEVHAFFFYPSVI